MSKIAIILAIIMVSCACASLSRAQSKKVYTVNLNVWERIKIKKLIPKTATLERAIIASSIKDKLELTPKEVEEFEVETSKDSITWNEKGKKGVDVEFTFLEADTLKKGVDDLSDNKGIEVSTHFVALCKKIKDMQPKN